MALYGIAADFVRVTLFEIASLGPVYTLSYVRCAARCRDSNLPGSSAPCSTNRVHYVFWPVMHCTVVAVTSERR
jgi:hypothetical protein